MNSNVQGAMIAVGSIFAFVLFLLMITRVSFYDDKKHTYM